MFITRYKRRRPTPLVVDLASRNPADKREVSKVLDPHKYNLDVESLLRTSTG